MYWFCCSNCGNIFGLESVSNGTGYCPKCHSYFGLNLITSNALTADSNNITIYTKAANKENKLDINAKSITINENKMSITIDKDNIDKFDVIEINGVRFVREDN